MKITKIMRIVHRYISFIAAVMCSGVLAAQNLDPTVEVSRAYEAKIAEAKKPVREMTVPDSVNTFRLDFDYSVLTETVHKIKIYKNSIFIRKLFFSVIIWIKKKSLKSYWLVK